MAEIYRPREAIRRAACYRRARGDDTFSTMPNPPYAVPTTSFRFAALATLAGKAPLGGRREVALAVYLSARLADDTLPERGVSTETRVARATHARSWLSSMAVPAPVRPVLVKLIDTTGAGGTATAQAIVAVISATGTYLDDGARLELERLARTISTSAA
jgi:hypothetical protein